MPYTIATFLWAFLLCLLSFNSLNAQAEQPRDSTKVPAITDDSAKYLIHIGTYQKLIPNTYFKSAGINQVKHIQDGNNFHRYYLGMIGSEKDAISTQEKIIKQGFPNAKIVSSDDDELLKKLKETTSSKFYDVTYDELFLRSVTFDFNSAGLDQYSKQLLEEVNMILQRNSSWIVQLSGHSDSIGSPEYNIKLSKTRVRAVRQYLIDRGIATSRIKTRVFGEAAPLAKNVDEVGQDVPFGRQLNRRVCVGIYDNNGEMVNIKDSTVVPQHLQIGQ